MKHKRFLRTSRWRRGYHCRQVDVFLARVEQSLHGTLPPMAASEIRRAGFELVHHGYRIASVDAHLDELEERLLVVENAMAGRRERNDPARDVQFLRNQLDEPHLRRFPRSRTLRRGYDAKQVDAFVDRVLDCLAELPGETSSHSDNAAVALTVEDVRTAGFKPRRGGYAESAVDETLDRVVEVLLVQRRGVDRSWTGHSPEPDVERAGPAT
jgi:DivIVA domain-containing protein